MIKLYVGAQGIDDPKRKEMTLDILCKIIQHGVCEFVGDPHALSNMTTETGENIDKEYEKGNKLISIHIDVVDDPKKEFADKYPAHH